MPTMNGVRRLMPTRGFEHHDAINRILLYEQWRTKQGFLAVGRRGESPALEGGATQYGWFVDVCRTE
jgi:hypothetical protein